MDAQSGRGTQETSVGTGNILSHWKTGMWVLFYPFILEIFHNKIRNPLEISIFFKP